jgi:hypothetical protein
MGKVILPYMESNYETILFALSRRKRKLLGPVERFNCLLVDRRKWKGYFKYYNLFVKTLGSYRTHEHVCNTLSLITITQSVWWTPLLNIYGTFWVPLQLNRLGEKVNMANDWKVDRFLLLTNAINVRGNKLRVALSGSSLCLQRVCCSSFR